MARIRILLVLSALLLFVACAKEPEEPTTAANTGNPSNTSSPSQASPSANVNEYGGSLIIAASKGDMPAVQLLLTKGSPVGETDKASGSNPLFEAIMIDRLDIIKLLVEKGADVNAKLNDGQSMLAIAQQRGRPEVIAFLESKGAKSATINKYGGSLIIAASKGDLPAVQLLLAKGSPVGETDKASGSNPLFEAIMIDRLDIIKLLVEHGANVNAKLNDGQSMLAIAKLRGKPGVISFLESKGAK